MDPKFQTSFIPKRPITFSPSARVRLSSRWSIFSLAGAVVFAVSLVLSGAVFFYQRSLVKEIDDMNKRLVEAKNSFEPETIKEIGRLGEKIETIKKILGKRLHASPIFSILEEKTLENARWTDFSYTLDAGGGNLSLSGEARSFNSVALQSDVFGKEKLFKNQLISGFTLEKTGNVSFNFQSSVDPKLILPSASVSTTSPKINF